MSGRIGQLYNKIVPTGLIAHLDASNPQSYAGSGTEWFDLSGNQNSASLFNGTIYDSNNGGSFGFDGYNDSGSLAPATANGDYDDYTWQVWLKPMHIFDQYSPLASYPLARGNDGYGFGWSLITAVYYPTPGTPPVYRIAVTRNENQIASPGFPWISRWTDATTIPATNRWAHVTGVYKRDAYVKVYINGFYENITILSSGSFYLRPSTIGWTLSKWPGGNALQDMYSGSIASLAIYNRELSDNEILFNYISSKTRFGL